MRRWIHTGGWILCLIALGLPMTTQAQDTTDINTVLEAGAQPVTVSQLVREEGFDEPAAWDTYQDESMNLRVENSEYRIEVFASNFFTWGLDTTIHTNVVIEADATIANAEPLSTAGIICRADSANSGDGYYFRITGAGEFGLFYRNAGVWEAMVNWTHADAILPAGETNHLTAVCVHDYLAFYINRTLVAEVNDARRTSGNAGLEAGTGQDVTVVDARFDNVRIWAATVPGAEGTESTTTSRVPQVLANYNGRWENTVAELEEQSIISEGGSLVFEEDYTFFSGQGAFFTPLARTSPYADVVMAGELTFNVGTTDEVERCFLAARINTDPGGTATTYIDAGFLNDGSLRLTDRYENSSSTQTIEIFDTDFDLSVPHHLLILILDNRMTVYVDGQLVVTNFEVVDRAGTYGIALIGRGPGVRCEGRNVWVYQAPAIIPGVCEITAPNVVNQRSGPGTNFGVAGQLTEGTITRASGQAIGTDEALWWQLDNGTWVRSNVVNAQGDCRNLPVIER